MSQKMQNILVVYGLSREAQVPERICRVHQTL